MDTKLTLKDGENIQKADWEEIRYKSHTQPKFIVCRGAIWTLPDVHTMVKDKAVICNKIRDLNIVELLTDTVDHMGRVRKFQR